MNKDQIARFMETLRADERLYPTFLALFHHRTHKNEKLDFKTHSYLKSIYMDNSRDIVLMKSTQCGLTEYLVVQAIAKAYHGRSIFYVMPTVVIQSMFIKDRLERTITNTPYYLQLKDENRSLIKSEGISLRHFNKGSIYFVGSNSESGFTSYPADDLIIDEYDQCNSSNLAMAEERLSHSSDPRTIMISNPTIEGVGIDSIYAKTDKCNWKIKCDSCGEWTTPDFFKHVVREVEKNVFVIRDSDISGKRDIRLICECGKPLDRYKEGEWVQTGTKGKRGYQISKLFSAKTTIRKLVENFDDAQGNSRKLQRFHNADLGMPYSSDGSKITAAEILECIADFPRGGSTLQGVAVAGIDVGSYFNFVVGKKTSEDMYLIDYGAVQTEQEVYDFLRKYDVRVLVIDANPETRVARKIASFVKAGFVCFYSQGWTQQVYEKRVVVDRTYSLDDVKAAISTKSLKMFKGANEDPEFLNQMTAATRVYYPDKNGHEGTFKWEEGSKDDHYMHAVNYMLIAAKILVKFSR